MSNPAVSPFPATGTTSAPLLPTSPPLPTSALSSPVKSPLAFGTSNIALSITAPVLDRPFTTGPTSFSFIDQSRSITSPTDLDSPEDSRSKILDPVSASTTALPDLPTTRLGLPSKVKPQKVPKDKDSSSSSSSWFGFKNTRGARSTSRLGGRSTPDPAIGPVQNSNSASSSPPPPPPSSASARSGTPVTHPPPPNSIYKQLRAPESTPDLSELSITSQDRPTLSRQHSLSAPNSSSPSSSKVSKQSSRKTEKSHRTRFAPFSNSKVGRSLFDDKSSSPLKPPHKKSLKNANNNLSDVSSNVTDAPESSNSTIPPRSRSVDPYNPRAAVATDSGHRKKGVDMPLSSSSVTNKDRFFSRVAGNLMSKIRSGNSKLDIDPPNMENYVYKVINLHLIEQTRKTRISPRLMDALDKTEFWMPAFPWRCIDYLNLHGCAHIGIYRVPGSERDVQKWKMKFDTEYDVDLLSDGPDDINTVGSMFKSWLRDLPDEIFPKSIQEKIAQENRNATEVPQMLKDELSKLAPYNYYLLFAITCHISLLHTQQAENKMDYGNLCICFQPCIRLNAFCFQFLVKHWKDCWQGCWTENEYLQLEARWDLMELQGDFSGPQTHVDNSPHNRHRDNDAGFDIFNGLGFTQLPVAPPPDEIPSVTNKEDVPPVGEFTAAAFNSK